MTTKVIFENKEVKTVLLMTLKEGSGFEFENKLYIKLNGNHVARIKGSKSLDDFEVTTFLGNTCVTPLNVEIKFSRP
ncbi:MAG: hypothetical protein ACRDC4_07850 [Plesiomonas sp.]